MSTSTKPWTPGPPNDAIDLEQASFGGAVNLTEENDPAFDVRRGQLVRVTIVGVVKGFQETARRSANTTMTVRKTIIDATDLETMELMEQPEARAQRDGQIEGQIDLRQSPDDAGDPAGRAEADVKAQQPDLGRQPVVVTLANGETVERGSRWVHKTTNAIYRVMAKGKSGNEDMILVADTNDVEDAFPIQSFGDTLARFDDPVSAEAAEKPAAPAEKPKRSRGAKKTPPADDKQEAERAAEIAKQVAGNGPVEHPDDVKGALGDPEA